MGLVSEISELTIARKLIPAIARAWPGTLYLVSCGVAGAAVIYAGTIVYGLKSGDALPTATIYFLWPITRSLHRMELFLPWGILAVAAIGAALGWVPGRLWRGALHRGERRLIAFWGRAGIPVIVLVFLFDMSGGGWSGQYLPTDFNYVSNAGLVPYSDARTYYGSAFEIAYWGHWNWIAAQRPLAAAFRNFTVLLGGETYPGTLVAQSVLVAMAIMFALRGAVAWRGFWAGLALFALLYGLVRPWLLTAMTESLGVFWAASSIGFFTESLRRRSLPLAMIGFATLTCAQMTRMGNMFSIPFLLLWLPFAFARQWGPRLKIFAGALGIVLGILAISGLLGWIYAAPGSETGGDFSSILCGLAHGSTWSECYKLLAAQIASAPSRHAVNHILYDEAIRAFRADPSVVFHELWVNSHAFVYTLPAILMEQYTHIGEINRDYLIVGLLLMIPGWCCVVRQPGGYLALSFALVLFISAVLSSTIIFANDGTRTMIVTYCFMALYVALGFTAPGSFIAQTTVRPLSWRRSALSLVTALLLLIVIPASQGAAARWAAKFTNPTTPVDPNVSVIPGKPVLTGFMVVPDGWRQGRDIPSLDISTYTAMYLAIYTPELGPSATKYLPKPPFAVISAVAQNTDNFYMNFIAPPRVLTDTKARRWRLQLDLRRTPPRGLPFVIADKATPEE